MIEASRSAQLDVFGTVSAGSHSLSSHAAIVESLEAGDVAEAALRVARHLQPAFSFPNDGL
jgi:DNA-binding GntR family transcriptional regulator